MLLCIIPPHFRRIPEILKELKRERRSERTDGQKDGWMSALLHMHFKGCRMGPEEYSTHLWGEKFTYGLHPIREAF